MAENLVMVGAGFSGATLGRRLAEAGCRVTVVEARPQPAGNCHSCRDAETGVMRHVYGPHIFHTDDAGVWDHVTRFGRFRPYRHRVKCTRGGQVFSLPINLHTINQFFGKTLRPDEARAFLAAQADRSITDPQTFEEQALAMLGRPLYEAFFKGYTEKQWGCAPAELPAAVLTRLPVRFSYEDGYFSHAFQGIPEAGYTALVEAMLDHPNIDLHLETAFDPGRAGEWDHVFWSGPLDGFFGARLGRLGYRTLDFELFRAEGDWQGCAVMNYADPEVPFTRITEHRHFAPWESHAATVLSRETPRACGAGDIPYYPIRLAAEQALLGDYLALAAGLGNVSFLGRLGTYRYLDMDVTIREALDLAEAWLAARAARRPPPVFPVAARSPR